MVFDVWLARETSRLEEAERERQQIQPVQTQPTQSERDEYGLVKNAELRLPCGSFFCQECRTGESDEENFYYNVAQLLGRGLSSAREDAIAAAEYDRSGSPHLAAIAIREGEAKCQS